jgi:hypothetical protein
MMRNSDTRYWTLLLLEAVLPVMVVVVAAFTL